MASSIEKTENSSSAENLTSLTPNVSSNPTNYDINKHPVCLVVLGMAGSGKTQFVKKLSQLSHIQNHNPYIINLDPACKEVPYHANIGEFFVFRFIFRNFTKIFFCSFIADIRDTVNYKEVMKQYQLGPNGGIVTALNLFSTKFGQVVDLVQRAGNTHKYCIIDTPGK